MTPSFSLQIYHIIDRVRDIQYKYDVPDKRIKQQIIERLNMNAKAWYYSSSKHTNFTSSQLLYELFLSEKKKVETNKSLKALSQRKWNWKKKELFANYYQAKLELAQGLNLSEKELVNHLIDGLDNDVWACKARSLKFQTTAKFLNHMNEEIRNASVNPYSHVQCFHCKQYGHKQQFCTNNFEPPTTKPHQPKQIPNIQPFNGKKLGPKKENYNLKDQTAEVETSSGVQWLKSNLAVGFKTLAEKLETVKVSENEGGAVPKKKQGDLCKNCYRVGHTANVCRFPAMPKGVCHNCGSPDHIRPNCPVLKKKVNKNDAPRKEQERMGGKKEHVLFGVE